MTPHQNQGAGKRRPPAIPLDHYVERLEKRTPNLFFVFYSGKVTEGGYFEELRDDLAGEAKNKNKSQFIHLKFAEGTPKQVVESAMTEVTNRKQKGTDNISNDIVWVVFDKDDFGANYSCAVEWAEKNEMDVAYSNECFELWLLLHFQEQTSPIGRGQLAEILRLKWEEIADITIDGKKRVKHFPYGIVRKHGDRGDAIGRAKLLLAQAKGAKPQFPWEVNPVTTVHELVEQLIAFFAE